MGDRVAVLREGILQQYGTPRSLYAEPANLFVAGFIGSPEMNLYEAGVGADGSLSVGSQRWRCRLRCRAIRAGRSSPGSGPRTR